MGKYRFPREFWLANLMELFERGAYYGMNSVLAVYLVKHLRFDVEAVGVLQGFFYSLTYIMPIIGGALAEKYGYRRMLMVAFSLLSVGYFATAQVTSYGLIFLFLLVVGTGSGLFKPIISGTIARTTTEENSGFGFGLYYWSINIGAFLAPIFIGWVKGFAWKYVFLSAASWTFLMLFPSAFLFREIAGGQGRSLKKALTQALEVLRDSRFMLMVVIYSAFWIVYFQSYSTLLLYVRDFIYRQPITNFLHRLGLPLQFDAEHITVLNAGTVILLVVLVSRLVKNLKPLPVMATGILIGTSGFAVFAFTRNPWLFLLGVVIFSIGEITAHPKYYSYVGLIAPKDRVAIYMGYSFIYGIIGSLVGTNLGAFLYKRILEPAIPGPGALARPLPAHTLARIRLFWGIFVVLGIMAMAGLLWFNRNFSTPETAPKAERIMRGIYITLFLLSIVFMVYSLIPPVKWKTLAQAGTMALLGGGGLLISKKPKTY